MMNLRSPIGLLLVSALSYMFVNGQVAETPLCGPNQHFEACGTKCPANCKNCSGEDPSCPPGCNQGCFCDEGYVLESEESKKCIPVKNCGSCCENSHYECCVGCFDMCSGTVCYKLSRCSAQCVCDDGYANHNEECILTSECPPTEK